MALPARSTNPRIALEHTGAELQRATHDVLAAIAIDALALGLHARLPTAAEYRERLQVGAGTVQKSFELLASSGALSVTSHGHLGRRIGSMDVASLWNLAKLGPVRIVLPPRGPIEVRAVAEALAEALEGSAIPFRIDHKRGGLERAQLAVTGAADLVVVSSGLVASGNVDAESVYRMSLTPGTYYSRDSLLVLTRGSVAGQARVAIDRSSYDQARMTLAEFPPDGPFTYVDVDFPRVPVAILRNEVDAGVWHRMQTLISPADAGLRVTTLQRDEALEVLDDSSTAELLFSKVRPELKAAMDALDPRAFESRLQLLLERADTDADMFDINWAV